MVSLADKISLTVEQAAVASGLSRASLYELMRDGALESRKVAGRRLVLARSLRRLIEGDQAETPEAA